MADRQPFCLQATAYGVPLEVCSDDQALLSQVPGYLPLGADLTSGGPSLPEPFLLLRSATGKANRLRRNNRTLFRHPEPGPVLHRLRALLTLHAAEHSPSRIFIHAGVVGWQGRAILLPGRSFAGKTTLTAELVRAGATYYSDEYAVIDSKGFIYPYAQPLQMRIVGELMQQDTPVSHLNGHIGTEPLRLSLVVVTHFQPLAEWNPESLSPGLAALELMRHTISARRDPAKVLKTLARFIKGSRAVISPRGEASLAAASILGLLSA